MLECRLAADDNPVGFISNSGKRTKRKKKKLLEYAGFLNAVNLECTGFGVP